MRITLPLLALTLATSGCGTMDQLRGHNIAMTIDAVESIPRTGGAAIHADAIERLVLLQRDFPAPQYTATIERCSYQDDAKYNAYAARVEDKETRRRRRDAILKPFKKTWTYIGWAIDIAPFLAIIWLSITFRGELKQGWGVLSRVISKTVKEKSIRKKIADGTPVGKHFDKMKRKGAVLVSDDEKTSV